MSRIAGDVDIDFPDRNLALSVIDHIPASIFRGTKIDKHNTGVYFHATPMDPITGLASIHFKEAEELGWFKIDLLNVGVYEQVRDEAHLIHLMNTPLDWKLFEYQEFTSQLIHLNNHSELVASIKPTNVSELAMVLALIRPGKRYLVDSCKLYGFDSIKNEIWEEPTNGGFVFKKSHATSYSVLVTVHANLLVEQAFQVDAE